MSLPPEKIIEAITEVFHIDYEALILNYVPDAPVDVGSMNRDAMTILSLHHIYDGLLGPKFGNGGHHIMQALQQMKNKNIYQLNN